MSAAEGQTPSAMLRDTNFYGQDYRDFAADDPSECRAACDAEGECKAWTFVKPDIQDVNGKCWLKDGVPRRTANSCCTSGVKAAQSNGSETAGQPGENIGPHLRVGGMAVTIARDIASDHWAADPTAVFSDRDTTVFLSFLNETDRMLRADVEVYPTSVHGFDPGTPYWRGAWVRVGGGQRHSVHLDGPESGLIPGTYRLEIRASGETRSTTMMVEAAHPLATILDSKAEGELGPNIALAALGGRAAVSSKWDDSFTAGRLIDGVNWVRSPEDPDECSNCGWASRKGDEQPTVTIGFNSGREAQIAEVVLDTRRFTDPGRRFDDLTASLPKSVAVSVSTTTSAEDFERVATARLFRDFLRQAISLPDGTRARRVRIEVLENFGGSPGALLAEVEVREAVTASPSVVEDLQIDLARPSLGGALVRYTGYSDQASAARLFDGTPAAWVSRDRYFPQDFTLAFKDDRLARIDRVEVVLEDGADPAETWPSEIAIAVSEHHPIDSFSEITRVPIEKRPGEHVITVDAAARYLKLRVLDNHGAEHTTIGEIRVIEDRESDGSVLSGEPAREAASGKKWSENVDADLEESEPNDAPDEASALRLGKTLKGRIDPLGEQDFFRLPNLDPHATAISLSYSGRPYIRHELSLLDMTGAVLSRFDPGSLPTRDAHLSFALTGTEEHLRLTEPPASVVVIWDTSGSMQGSEGDLERAVREYIRLAPESQEIRLVRFSEDVEVLGSDFTTSRAQLVGLVDGKFRPKGGTRLYDAILRGLELLDGRSGNRAIVLMTDGNDTSPTWLGEVWSALEQDRVRLYTIGIGRGLQEYSREFASTGERILGHLAAGTNGQSFFAVESAALEEFYVHIAEELAAPATYLLTPTQEIGEGLLQLLAVGEQVPSAAMPAVHVIFDVSGSMSEALPGGGARIDAAKAAMFNMLDNLPDSAPFGLTVYGARIPESPDKERACTDIATVQDLAPLDKAAVRDFISDLHPRGGTTPLARSIAHVVRNFEGENGGIVVAITDGIEECDPKPLVTVGELASRDLQHIELNVIGFDLRESASKQMMQEIARLGRGKFFDAADGEAVAKALTTAVSARYRAFDAAGQTVASGKIDGPPEKLPPGWYTVEIAAADGPRRTTDVRIERDLVTRLEVNKVGRDMDVKVLPPRPFDPLVECGRPAERRDQASRVRRVQQKLNDVGFDVGRPDGIAGPATRAGIAAFIKAHDLKIEATVTLLLEKHLDCLLTEGEPFTR